MRATFIGIFLRHHRVGTLGIVICKANAVKRQVEMRNAQNGISEANSRKRRARRWLIALAAAGVALTVGKSVQANTVFWAVDASGDWSTPSNWSTNSLPGPADDVIFNRSSGGYGVTLSTGGELDINSFTNVNANFTEASSYFTFAAGTTSTNGAAATLTEFSGGMFVRGAGATFNNQGTFSIYADGYGIGSRLTLNNSGTLNSWGSGRYDYTVYSGTMNNTGIMNVNSGELDLASGSNTGTISVRSGATLNLQNFTIDGNGIVDIAGLVGFTAGTSTVNVPFNSAGNAYGAADVTFNQPYSGGSYYEILSGTTTFNAPVTVPVQVDTGAKVIFNAPHTTVNAQNGGIVIVNPYHVAQAVNWAYAGTADWNTPANWSTGSAPKLGDDVVLNGPSGSIVTISTSPAPLDSLVNNQTVILNAGAISGYGSSLFITNNGTFNVPGNGTTFGSGFAFTNNGTFTSPTGSSFARFNGTSFNNPGTLSVASNELDLLCTSASTSTGTVTVASGSLLSAQNISFTAGSVSGSGTFNLSGNWTIGIPWTFAGTANFSGTGTFSSDVDSPITVNGNTTFNGPINAPLSVSGNAIFNAPVNAQLSFGNTNSVVFNANVALPISISLTGSNPLSGSGSVSFTSLVLGGILAGPGARTIVAGGTMTGGGQLATNLTNNGAMTQLSSNSLGLNGLGLNAGVTLTNNGAWTLTDAWNNPNYPTQTLVGGGTIVNNGTINLSNNTTSTPITIDSAIINNGTFNNNGAQTVNITEPFTAGTGSSTNSNGGPLNIFGVGTVAGGLSGNRDGPLNLYGSNIILNPGASVGNWVNFYGPVTVNEIWNTGGNGTFAAGVTFNQDVNSGVTVAANATFNGAINAPVTINGGNVTVSQNLSNANFTLADAPNGRFTNIGTLNGPGNISFAYLGLGGTLDGPGTRTITSTGSASITNGFLTTNLTNNGTMTQLSSLSAGLNGIGLNSGVTLTNNGVWSISCSVGNPNYYPVETLVGGGTIVNNGTMNVSNNTVTDPTHNLTALPIAINSTIINNCTFTTSGGQPINVNQPFNSGVGSSTSTTTAYGGPLNLNAGGTEAGSFSGTYGCPVNFYGAVTLNPGAAVGNWVNFYGPVTVNPVWTGGGANFAGGVTFNEDVDGGVTVGAGATFNGAINAPVTINGGTVSVSQNLSNANFTLTGGTLNGTGDISFSNLVLGDLLAHGTLGGPGARTIIAGGTLSGGGGLATDLTNNGTMTQLSSNSLGLNGLGLNAGVTLTNNGTWTLNDAWNNPNYATQTLVGGGTIVNNATINLSNNTTSTPITIDSAINNNGTFNTYGGQTINVTEPFNSSAGSSTNSNGATLNLYGAGTEAGSLSGNGNGPLNFYGTVTLNPGVSVGGWVYFYGSVIVDEIWTGGSGTFAGGVTFNRDFDGGANITGNATFNGAVRNGVTVSSGSNSFNGLVAASVQVGGGNAYFTGTVAGPVQVSGGNVIFASVVSSGGSVNWTGGTIAGAASLNISSGGILNVTTPAAGLTLGQNIINAGIATITAAAPSDALNLSAGVTLTNNHFLTLSAATLNLNSDASNPARLLPTNGVTLSGTTTIATSGSGQIPGSIDLTGGTRSLTCLANSTATISARVTNGGLMIDGPGTIILTSTANNFSGGLNVANGLVEINAASNFSGGVLLSANGPLFGTLQVGSDGQLGASSNSVTLAGGTLQAAGTFSTARSVILGTATGNGNGTIAVTSGNTLTLNGLVSGLTGLIMQGPGSLVLNGSLSYSGSTQVLGGTLQLGPGIALPTQSVVSVAPGATLDLGGQSRTFSALKDITGAGGSGSISLGSATLTVGPLGASTIFSGNINGSTGGAIVMSGAGSMALTGSLTNFTGGASVMQGTLLLGGSANTFTGGVSASHGTLSVSSDGAMGNPANGISLSSAGILAVTNSFSTARHLSVGTGSGILEVASSSTLIDSGIVTGSTSLTLSGTAGTAGGGGMWNITSAESFSGSLTIDGSSASAGAFDTTLLLSGAGTMDNLSALSLVRQGTLELYDAGGLTSGRLGSSTQLNLSGGTLSVMGPNSAMASESLGKLDLVQGSSVIDLIDGSSGTVDLTFASYTRTPGAQVYLEMSPSDAVFFTSMPSGLINGMTLVEGGQMGHAQYSQTFGVEFFGATVPATTIAPAFAFSATPSPVPEPGGISAVLAGYAALSIRRRRNLPGSGPRPAKCG